MSSGDFVRQMPGVASEFSVRPSVWSRWHIDIPLVVLLLLLIGFGATVLYSASGQSLGAVYRQLLFFAVGFVGMFIVAQFKMDVYQRWAPIIYIGGVALLLAVEFMGTGAKGAQRWLDLGGFRFQPSEVIKLVLPLTVAWFLAEKILPPRFRDVFLCVALIAVPVLLIARQPDLGTSILVAASGVFVLLLAGLSWRFIIIAAAGALISAVPLWLYVLHDYQKQRVLTLLDPESDKLGAGWNIIQSKTAIGSGGIEGKGWLNGTQSQLDFLPESRTDFIIAVLAEEYGLIGVLILLSLYLLIIFRGMMIGARAQSTFSRLVAGSVTLTFFVYVFVNIGMVSGLLPVVGVPLPLVSHGGTSIVSLMAGFGFLMAISTERRQFGQ